ncbi:hypothetical protein PV797_03130 [Clostridiaceae bacterium M8S5]|nr:hypothetical protein PV797_03130 [Clostridiaceae bacterium M8S5]
MKNSYNYVLLGICSLIFVAIVTMGTYIYLESKDKEKNHEANATSIDEGNLNIEQKEKAERADSKEPQTQNNESVYDSMYKLSDEEIESTILLAKVNDYEKRFLINNIQKGETSVTKAYLQTPQYKIMEYSNTLYFCEKPVNLNIIKEEKGVLYPKDIISIKIGFENNSADSYNVELFQNNKKMQDKGLLFQFNKEYSIVVYNPLLLDLKQQGEIIITNKFDNNKKAKILVNFSDYSINNMIAFK